MKRVFGQLIYRALRSFLSLAVALLRKSVPLRNVAINVVRNSPAVAQAVSLGLVSASNVPSLDTRPQVIGSNWISKLYTARLPGVSIVVPIHNAYEAIKVCLEALSESIPNDVEVILINDSSTDLRMGELLTNFSSLSNWKLITNEVNLGYTKTVNLGIRSASVGNDIILLNSDTVPLGNWVQKLRYAAHRSAIVGTVTPISDNSGAFSMPLQDSQNLPPKGWALHQFALALEQAGYGKSLEVASGNGFCFYVKREVYETIGLFDEELFPRGYGEENHFSMRVLENGWTNEVSDKVFVSHLGSQSFGSARERLTVEGLEKVIDAFPAYPILNMKIFGPQFKMLSNRIQNRLSSSAIPLPRILFLQPISGGGLPLTNDDLSSGLDGIYEQFKLVVDKLGMVSLEAKILGIWKRVEEVEAVSTVNPIPHWEHAFDAWFAELLYKHSIDVVHAEHLQFFSTSISKICKEMGVVSSFSIHDYYTICPNTQLIDNLGTFCGGICSEDISSDCESQIGVISPIPKLKHSYIQIWQKQMAESLGFFDTIFAPTVSAKNRLSTIYPHCEGRIVVVEHGRDDLIKPGLDDASRSNRILVLGHIGDHKGAKLLRELIGPLKKLGLELEVIGSVNWRLKKTMKNVCEVSRDNVVETINGGNFAAALFLSIWEETYVHTLSEAWAAGLPSISVAIGALEERTKDTGNGFLIPMDLVASPGSMARRIRDIVDDTEAMAVAKQNIRIWQSKGPHDTRAMGRAYNQNWQRRKSG